MKGHGAGVTVGKCMHMEIFFFVCNLIPHFFLLCLSLSLPFLLPFLAHAGPFEAFLIGVDGAALGRYNGKLNIFGSKI